MKKQIITILALLMLLIVPLTFANSEVQTPSRGSGPINDYYNQMKQCTKDGGTWIFDDWQGGLPIPMYYGHCEYPPVTPPVNQPNSGNKNHWTDKTCNFDRKDVCRFRFKINQLVGLQHEGEDYTLDYVKYTKGAWYNNLWKFWRQSDPVISITAENGNSVYYGTPEEGEVLFDNLELTDFDFAGYFVWMTVKKVE